MNTSNRLEFILIRFPFYIFLPIGSVGGTFLIRFSTSSPGAYTISKVSISDLTIKHQKVVHRMVPGPNNTITAVFEINGRAYSSLRYRPYT